MNTRVFTIEISIIVLLALFILFGVVHFYAFCRSYCAIRYFKQMYPEDAEKLMFPEDAEKLSSFDDRSYHVRANHRRLIKYIIKKGKNHDDKRIRAYSEELPRLKNIYTKIFILFVFSIIFFLILVYVLFLMQSILKKPIERNRAWQI